MQRKTTTKILANVQVGDAIWSGGRRWIVTERLKTVLKAQRDAAWAVASQSWRYDGSPAAAAWPAEPETPELIAQWQQQEAEKAERARQAREAMRAEDIVSDALSRLRHSYVDHPGNGRAGIRTLPLAKALALARFVDQLTREGE